MKVKTSELSGRGLDWAVAQCEGVKPFQWECFLRTCDMEDDPENEPHCYKFSTQWSAGGPIIERERIDTWVQPDKTWKASYGIVVCGIGGPTPLIAAMRCFVASRLGDEVEIPEELL